MKPELVMDYKKVLITHMYKIRKNPWLKISMDCLIAWLVALWLLNWRQLWLQEDNKYIMEMLENICATTDHQGTLCCCNALCKNN